MDRMAWDASRTVPWGRLVREWLVYVAVMAIVFVLFLRDTVTTGSIVGLFASLPMYLIDDDDEVCVVRATDFRSRNVLR